MDISRPLAVVTPTLDGDVLALLARGHVKLTGREIARRIGASQEGSRRALERLVKQGIVMRERVGKAHSYALNRKHLGAEPIVSLATLRQRLLDRLREEVAAWSIVPAAVFLFGSIARGEGDDASDIDILVVRSRATPEDDPVWRRQLVDLADNSTAMTGNDTRLVEYSAAEAVQLRRNQESIVATAATEGIALGGSLDAIQARRRSRARS
jgi:predicted nucleotidyltransferase